MSDDDIEFLDEDAEIVQQCVQSNPQLTIKIEPLEDEPPPYVIQRPKKEPFLVEREIQSTVKTSAKKKKKEDDDTDYDPRVDSPHAKRRRRNPSRPTIVRKYESSSQQSPVRSQSPVRKVALREIKVNRREMTIQLPDFNDPLCLPVRAMVRDEGDARRLLHWNQQCLRNFNTNFTPLRPRDGPTKSSKRTVVIRNLFNKYSGKTETTFWSKIVVEGSKKGDIHSEVVQSVLPRYREKKILKAYTLHEAKKRKGLYERHEVILTKEKCGDEETLVAYKPQDSLAMVFKMFENETQEAPEIARRYLREMASAAACARCYQASYRPGKDTTPRPRRRSNADGPLASCPICARGVDSAGALVAHVRAHAAAEVGAHRADICQVLAKLLPYLYRCRICQQQFDTVKDLRLHLQTHKGVGEIYCEVGNHLY